MYICVCVYTCEHVVYMHTCVSLSVCVCVYMYLCACVYMCVCIYVGVCVCAYSVKNLCERHVSVCRGLGRRINYLLSLSPSFLCCDSDRKGQGLLMNTP